MKKILENKIKILRAEREITQEDLGLACGLSRQSINAIETGKYVPTVITALKIAKYFDRNIEEIFNLIE